MPANPDDIDAGSPISVKKSGSPIVPLLAVIILVPALVYAVMNFVIVPKIIEANSSHSEETSSHSESATKGHTAVTGLKETPVDFASLVVNLAGSGNTRYLRVNIVVASSDSKIGDHLKDHEAPLKDAAITILSAQTPESIETPAGKDVVRRNLMTSFNRLLGADVIGQVYFKEFVVQ
jgi:flagellar protein FliL